MADIRTEWDKADTLESRADDQKWKVSRLLTEANDGGKTYRVLAEETGRSHTTVGRWIRTWRQFGTHKGSRPFNECLEEVRSETRTQRRADSDRSTALKVVRDGDEEETRELFQRASNRDADRRELRLRLDRQKQRRDEESNKRVGFRTMEFVGNNAKIRRLLNEQLKLIQNVELPEEAQELGREAIDQIIETAKLVQLALQGGTDIDWDAEFSKLT